MISKKKSTIDRVRDLLAMAAQTESSPHEAAMASKRARYLIDKHQLSESDLEKKSEFSDSGLVGAKRKFIPIWEQVLFIAVGRFNDCKVARNVDGDMVFRGFSLDVDIAKYMFLYLVHNGKVACSAYMKRKGYTRYNASVGTAFKQGYSSTVAAKIREMASERVIIGTGLMVIKSKLVEAKFGLSKVKKARIKNGDSDARGAGKAAGEKTSIHTGIDGSPVSQSICST